MARTAAGFIFDIDGTLVDSNDLHAQAWLDAFREFGKDLPYDTIRMQIGKGGDLLVPDLLNAREMRTFGKKLQTFRKSHFRRNYLSLVRPFPGVREQFEVIRGRKANIVLASSADPEEVDYFIELLNVKDLIVGSTSTRNAKFSKPSPEIFEAALEKLGTPKSRTMTVGDTPYDILAAHRVALAIVALRCGGFPDDTLSKAEFLFDNTHELLARLDQIDQYFQDE